MMARVMMLVALLAALATTGWSAPLAQGNARNQGKKEYTFKGTVEKVDAQAEKLTVNGETVDGWMKAMTMDYKVDKAEVLKSLQKGDQITAKVYDGDFQTLYDVRKAPAPSDKK
jgi:Cu/Ag efflux protein CusF